MVRWGKSSRDQLVFGGSIVASLLVHAALMRVDANHHPAFHSIPAPAVVELALDTSPGSSGASRADTDGNASAADYRPVAEPLLPGGGSRIARPDTGTRGRGGEASVRAPAINLADRDDRISLSRELNSRLDRDQVQRLQTSRSRASHDDRRSSREPMNLIFLATGDGQLQERRPSAASDPSRGALRAPAFADVGALVARPSSEHRADANSPERSQDEPSADGTLPWFEVGLDGRQLGRAHASPGLGVLRGVPGRDHRLSAHVATGRPLVAQAAPSVASNEDGRVRDNVDSNQEVAATVQSLVHASTAGGTLGGEGEGGSGERSGPAGSGGRVGAGSHADPFGGGPGGFLAQGGVDPQLSAYRRSVIAKIYPLWEHAFPKSASYEGKQGRAIVAMTIYADGHVGDVRLARASGVPEFDVNVQSAVRRAAPFDAFPSSIPGPAMRWSITFDMSNPAVR